MGKRIGILLDHPTLKRIPHKRTGFEKITYYNRAAKAHKMIPFYTSLDYIKPLKNMAKGYEYSKGYRMVTRSIPKVIHNRSMPFSKSGKKMLKAIQERSFVFNGQTRYSKYAIHKLLKKDENIRLHLPVTVLFSKTNLELMMSRFQSLFIKPLSGSLGKGIITIEKGSQGWVIHSQGKESVKQEDSVYTSLKGKIRNIPYLIQQTIPLAQYDGRPYDLRVSVQRSKDGQWQVTGMVGKVAGKGKHVTNVANGGKVIRCEELFAHSGLSVEETKEAIVRFSVEVAKSLEKKLYNLADIGFDIGVDDKGYPYFIEMNGRDLRYSFRNANLYKTWYKTYENPIKYAEYLYHKNKKHRP